jgi:hypothetical protein
MGSALSSMGSQQGHYRKDLSNEEYISRIQSENSNQTGKKDQLPAHTPKTARDELLEMTEATPNTEQVLSALKAELMKNENELDAHKTAYRKLKQKNYRLHKAGEEQREKLKYYQDDSEQAWALLDGIVERYLKPYRQKTGLELEDWDTESVYMVLGQMVEDTMDASNLQDQIQVLQKELLSKADKVQAIPDEELAQDFRVIVSLIKTLSRTIRLNEVIDLVAILGGGLMLEDVSRHHWSTRPRKKCLVEAWVWSVLLKSVFYTPFSILGDECEALRGNWRNLFFQDHVHSDWPVPSALCETWRRATMEQMMLIVDRDAITKGEPKTKHQILEASVLKARDVTMKEIHAGLINISVSSSVPEMRNIIDKSFTLAMKMSLQRCRLQVAYPKPGDTFDAQRMTSMSDADGGEVNEGKVAFVVNPGLVKWGDAHGQHLDCRYDIVPALVQLESKNTEKSLEQAFMDMEDRGL